MVHCKSVLSNVKESGSAFAVGHLTEGPYFILCLSLHNQEIAQPARKRPATHL